MPFKIVQTIEDGEICLSVVPSGWETKGILRWPKKHLVGKLSQIETSVPDDKWEKLNCVKKREFQTRKEADIELDRMEARSDTEIEDNPVAPPKKRFRQGIPQSSVYPAKDFNSFVGQLMTTEKVEPNSESSPMITASMPENYDQVLYVTENIDPEEREVEDDSSQVIILSGSGQTFNHTTNFDTILENQRTILQNQSKIIQALAKIQTNQEYAVTHCYCRSTPTAAVSTQQRNEKNLLAPVNSVEELEALEKSLEDGSLMQQFSSEMRNGLLLQVNRLLFYPSFSYLMFLDRNRATSSYKFTAGAIDRC